MVSVVSVVKNSTLPLYKLIEKFQLTGCGASHPSGYAARTIAQAAVGSMLPGSY